MASGDVVPGHIAVAPTGQSVQVTLHGVELTAIYSLLEHPQSAQ
ncbi:MAG: hypothetical protein AB7H80_01395 [Candidatus Kapaibacterium sp.]